MLLGSSILGVPYFISPSNVLFGVVVPGNSTTGAFVAPPTNKVANGYAYGVAGNMVGTFSGGGGGFVFPLGG